MFLAASPDFRRLRPSLFSSLEHGAIASAMASERTNDPRIVCARASGLIGYERALRLVSTIIADADSPDWETALDHLVDMRRRLHLKTICKSMAHAVESATTAREALAEMRRILKDSLPYA